MAALVAGPIIKYFVVVVVVVVVLLLGGLDDLAARAGGGVFDVARAKEHQRRFSQAACVRGARGGVNS